MRVVVRQGFYCIRIVNDSNERIDHNKFGFLPRHAYANWKAKSRALHSTCNGRHNKHVSLIFVPSIDLIRNIDAN